MTHQIEDEGHPHPCWWLRRQYMAARSADLWWRLQQLRPSSMWQAKRALYSFGDAELGSALPQEVTSSQSQSPHCAASAASGVSRFVEISDCNRRRRDWPPVGLVVPSFRGRHWWVDEIQGKRPRPPSDAERSRVGSGRPPFSLLTRPSRNGSAPQGEGAIRGEGTDRSAAKSVIRSKVSDRKFGGLASFVSACVPVSPDALFARCLNSRIALSRYTILSLSPVRMAAVIGYLVAKALPLTQSVCSLKASRHSRLGTWSLQLSLVCSPRSLALRRCGVSRDVSPCWLA